MKRFWIVLLVMALLGASVMAQDDTAAELVISDELQEQIDLIEQNTELLRELEPLEEIEIYFPTRAELRAYLDTVFVEEYNADAVALDTAFYVAFDLIPADYDLYNELLAIYEQQIGGYYDTDTQIMNVILNSGERPEDFLPLLERIVYAHEYVHALQDQYFDLDTYLEGLDPATNADAYLAALAVVEGDATFIMNEYTVREAEANPVGALLQIGLATAQNPSLLGLPPGTPDIFTDELLFPYNDGAVLVGAMFAEGGWDAVNAMYDNPPVSSEQVLHPEKYIAGELPIVVDLAEISTELGDNWELARSGVLGEFYLSEYLDTQLLNAPVTEASNGWGGDAYNIYRDADGSFAWHAQIEWDTDTDAEEFATHYATFITERLGEDATVEGNCTTGAELTICTVTAGTTTNIGVAASAEMAQQLLGS